MRLWDQEFKIACLVHQSLVSLAPTYLTTDIHLASEYGHRPLRSSTDRTLTVPWTHNRFGDRSFAVAGPRLWNSLPISLRQISSFGQFRRCLKNHLFGIWKITAQCDAWFSALYKYSYLLTIQPSSLKVRSHRMRYVAVRCKWLTGLSRGKTQVISINHYQQPCWRGQLGWSERGYFRGDTTTLLSSVCCSFCPLRYGINPDATRLRQSSRRNGPAKLD